MATGERPPRPSAGLQSALSPKIHVTSFLNPDTSPRVTHAVLKSSLSSPHPAATEARVRPAQAPINISFFEQILAKSRSPAQGVDLPPALVTGLDIFDRILQVRALWV